MKKPTSNGNDLYQIGNDYPQVASAYFNTDKYADGIYTEIKFSGFEVSSKDGFDDAFFLGKEPDGLNKRILNIPQEDWDVPVAGKDFVGDDISAISSVSAVYSEDYAVAKLTGFKPKE